MRVAAISVALLVTACQPRSEPAAAAIQSAFPLRVSGTMFVDASGNPFDWRGITAFRLAEMIAAGREQETVAYLDWAKSEQLTVVRVLLMAQHLFKLSPAAGRAALPRLLDLAKERGIAVEVVALADTKDAVLDYDAHIKEVGRIALEKGNAFIEIANEPGHPTQDTRLHDARFAKRLADLVPGPVIVALGSVEYGDGYADGDYATFHFPRGHKDWEHVFGLAAGADHIAQLKKPVVSDEPIGAASEYQPGRRDNEPARFAAAAALTRLVGMGATFHYEGGLHATIPSGREGACLAAWQTGLALLNDVNLTGAFIEGDRAAQIAKPAGAQKVYARSSANEAVVLAIDPRGGAPVTLAEGWKEIRRAAVPGAFIAVAAR